ncbi:unnamed protein product [Closterium sp. NIES-54]
MRPAALQPANRPALQLARFPALQPARCPALKPARRPALQLARCPALQPARCTALPCPAARALPCPHTLQPARCPVCAALQPTCCPALHPARHPALQPARRPALQPARCPARLLAQPSASGDRQQQPRHPDTLSSQQLRDWVIQRGCPGGGGYGPGGTRQQWQSRSPETLSPQQLRERVIQRCRPGGGGYVHGGTRQQRVGAYALGASESAAPLGASAFAATCAIESAASAEALHTFTLDSDASRCFFRDCTTVTPLAAPVPVSLGDPSAGPVVARASTVLPCPAVLSGSLSGLHLPSFSTNLVSNAVLQDVWVDTFTPGGQRVAICQVAASSQVSASGQLGASCSCRVLSHQTLLRHHRLHYPSLPCLRSMHSRLLVSGLPRSLPPLPRLLAPPCLPCVEGRQSAAPHSSLFPPTTAPLQTLHMDAPGPSAPATATVATATTIASATTAAATAATATAATATAAPAYCATMASLGVLTFDHEGRPVQFDSWLDDLELYLLSDSNDSVSLFDLASVEDLVSHLRISDARYRATVPAEFLDRNQPLMFITLYFIVTRLPDSLRSVRDHFLSLDPTSLTVDVLEQHLLVAETSAVAIGAARGTPRLPFFEGCSPFPLAPSYAFVATADISVAEDIGAASASVKRRSSKGKGGRGGGGGSGGGGGGSESGSGGSSGGSGGSGGGGGGGTGGGSGGSGGGGGDSGGSGGRGGSASGGGRTGPRHGGPGSGQRQQQQRRSETQSPQQLRECIAAAALGASESGTLPGIAPAEALHTFTLDSGASRCFFRDSTTLTPLPAPVPVRLADPSGGPVVLRSSTVLPSPAVPSGSLSGLHLPSFSTNLVSTAALKDAMVTTTTPGGHRVSICTCTWMGRHLATFTRRPRSSLYTLATEPPQVAASAQVSASGKVAASCSCRLLSHQTLLWHHRLGHPSLPRLRGIHSRLLVSGLPRSLPPLPPSHAPPYLPCVEGRQRAAPHSSFPSTTAPLQTLHMDVWGPARVSGQSRERYFLLVVDDYTRYTTVFPLHSKVEVVDVLIPWIRTVRLQLRERCCQDLPVLRLHSERGGEFSSDLLRDFSRGEGILQSFTLPNSPQQNGIAKRRIGLVMETSPTLRWTGEVGDASVFWVWGSRAFVRDTSADKLFARAIPNVFLGFVPHALGWQFYHPTLRRVFPSQDVTFDESVPFYRLYPYRSAPPSPPLLFLAPGPPPVDPLPPQGPAPSGVSQVDPLPGTASVQVAVGSGAAPGAASWGAASGGAESEGTGSEGEEPGGAAPAGVATGGVEPGGAISEGAESGGAEPWGAASSGGPAGSSPRLSEQQLREWLVRRARLCRGATGGGGAGDAGAGGAGFTAGAGGTGGIATAGPGSARSKGVGAAGTSGVGSTGAGGSCAGAGGPGVGGTGAGGARAAGARGIDPGVGGAGGTVRPRPYFVPLLQQVLGVPSSTSLPPPLLCPQPDRSQLPLQPASPLPAPSPYTEQSGGLTERLEPASRPVLPVRTARRVPRLRPPPVPGTHAMALHPSSVPLRFPLPAPPESSLPEVPDPESDRARAACPTVSRLLATAVIDPSFESVAASALVAELLDFAVACRLDYANTLVAESASASPPSIRGECALGMDVHEERSEDFECLAAAVPRFASMLLAPDGDPDAPDIPTPRSYAEAITGTYVDEVPPPGANIVDGMWIFRVKRPPGSPPDFKARYVARGFSQQQGVDYFQTFSPTPKMTTLWWRDTPRTTLATLGFAPSTADPSLFLRTNTSLPPFYVLVYVDDLVFATADTKALTLVKSELQKRHTCTDLGELRNSLGLQITWDKARRTITLTQSHMVHQVLQRFGFRFSSPQPTPLSTSHSLLALPSDESVEPSGPYPELVGCLTYLMTCKRPDLAYPLSLQARYVALGRHRKVHWDAAKRVLRYLCSTSGMGLVLGGWGPVVLTGHADASWAEIYAGAMTAQELRWLTYLLTDLGEQPCSPQVLYVDNKAMIALCQEHRLEHQTKHIVLRYFLARELQQRGQLRLAYVATRANTADVFTKALPPFLCLHSDRGGEFSSGLLAEFYQYEGIVQSFTLPASPQKNGIAERHIGLIMEVARTSMIHAAAPHFLWPFAVPYAAHQLNLWPRVSSPETSPTLHWTGEGPAPLGVSQEDPLPLVEALSSPPLQPVAVDTGAVRGCDTGGEDAGGAGPRGAETGGAETRRGGSESVTGSGAWIAMDAEMASWKSTGTYVDEVPPPGANIGVDFFQTFSPTPKMTTLRVLLHVAAQHDYELHSLDFNTAFLQGSLHEEIWLRRPPGFTGSFPPGTQWSLRRPVYGLHQAPREWHDTLRTTLAALGFAPSTADPRDTRAQTWVLQRFGFTWSSAQATPLATGHSLSAPPSDESVEPSGPYPELVGSLMYIMTCTRPDLAYPLGLLARYVAPGWHRKVHMDAAKRVLRYLCSTSGMGFVLGGRGDVVLTSHSDDSWVDDQATQWSSQGNTFSLGFGSVSWRSTRSASVLSSSCEAEIYATAMAAQELRWLTYLLTDLGEQSRSPPVLYVDNKAAIALCQEHRLEHRTKHIALRYLLARELQQRGQHRLAHVATRANTADIFTKALPPGGHQRFCTLLGLVPTLPHLL